jgi:opacity protein-like surface antigen
MKYLLSCAVLLLPGRALARDSSEPSEHAARHPLRAALAATSAVGVSNAGFFNQLLGARLDYRFTPRFAFGGVLSYTNLKGKDRRVHNVLPEAMLEYRIPYDGERFGLPLRFGVGYLPKNGPTLRLGAGVDFAVSERVSLDVVPLEPMIWVNRERPEVSMNASLSLRLAW